MATFVMLGQYTPDAVKGISAERTDAATKIIDDAGGKVVAGYALLGDVDLVFVVEFPNVDQAMKASLGLTNLTGISITTSPAISVEAFDKLVG